MSYYHLFLASTLMSSGFLLASSEAAAMTLTQSAPLNGFSHQHTPTPSTESAPLFVSSISSNLGYQMAGICFIGFGGCAGDGYFSKAPDGGSGGSGGDYDIDTKKQCLDEGFSLTSCPTDSAADNLCPYDSNYFQSCISYKQLCEQDNYYQNCSGDMVLDNSQTCKYDSSFKKCTSGVGVCESEGYFSFCEEGKIKDPGQTCPQEESYQKCVCSPCEGYHYTYDEAGAKGYEPDGDACNSCGEMKYKRKVKECLGFVPCDCGGEIDATECWSGDVQKFTTCKSCKTECVSGEINLDSYWCNGDFKCLFGGR